MLTDAEKQGKAKKRQKEAGNGKDNGHLLKLVAQQGEALQAQAELIAGIGKTLQEVQEQYAEIARGQDAAGKARLFVSERVYNTDRQHRSEMTNLPTMAIVEPFALATTLGSLFDQDVVEGKVSLADNYMDETKKLFRGYKGGLQQLAADHARDQESHGAEGTGPEPYDLGRGI